MTGPSFKFWKYTREDWPYAIFVLFGFCCMAIAGLVLLR